jgi:hypothetical protein
VGEMSRRLGFPLADADVAAVVFPMAVADVAVVEETRTVPDPNLGKPRGGPRFGTDGLDDCFAFAIVGPVKFGIRTGAIIGSARRFPVFFISGRNSPSVTGGVTLGGGSGPFHSCFQGGLTGRAASTLFLPGCLAVPPAADRHMAAGLGWCGGGVGTSTLARS